MEDVLLTRLREVLSKGKPMSAPGIARILKVERSEVNSLLYRYKGELFKKSDGAPPQWTLLDSSSSTSRPYLDHHLTRELSSDIHVDLAGGDWTITILLSDSSRNDPIVEIVRSGLRKRIIAVSRHVFSTDQETSGNHGSSDAAIAIAASPLVWEYVQSFEGETPMDFDWGLALKDVYLSIAAGIKSEAAN